MNRIRSKAGEVTLSTLVKMSVVIGVLFIAVQLIVGLLIFQAVKGISSIEENQDRDIVQKWTIEPVGSEFTVGEGFGIPLIGEFICNDPVTVADPLLQFKSEVVSTQAGFPRSIRPVGAPRGASVTCENPEPREFLAGWDTMESLEDLTEPAEYRMLFSVTAEGWIGEQILSAPFIVNPPNS